MVQSIDWVLVVPSLIFDTILGKDSARNQLNLVDLGESSELLKSFCQN